MLISGRYEGSRLEACGQPFPPPNYNSDDPASYVLRNSTAWLHPAVRCVCHECEYDNLFPFRRNVYTREGVDSIQTGSPVIYCHDW